jgi:long-chain acyl-CoA synthetase
MDTETFDLKALFGRTSTSLGALFQERVAATPGSESFRRPDAGGGWRSDTWADTGRAVSEIAAGFLRLGLRPQDRVAIASGTRVEWIEADLAVLSAGGATTTIYPTSTADDVAHILTDSGSRFAVLERASQLGPVLASGASLERVILIEGEAPDADERVLTLARLRALGRAALVQDPQIVSAATAEVHLDDLATLIYTSGTTGRPKGVRLTHGSWVYEGLAIESIGLVTADDLGYLWLPLAHSFGKALIAGQLAVGHAAVVDPDVGRIVENLSAVRPTVVPAVPRIFEKIHAGVQAKLGQAGKLEAWLFSWAVRVGREDSRMRLLGERPGLIARFRHRIADRLVLARLRERFGGRIRYFVSGAARLDPEIAAWFDALGLLVLEGYGLTESSAATFVNRPGQVELGTVGLPMPGTQVRIAEDGEILLRGPGVMDSYHHRPEATTETLVGGWLHTGDIGELTELGSLRITDRKKDLIKTSGGKYVAPQAIETRFTAGCPLAGQILVHGEGRNYISALISLDPAAARAWALEQGMAGATHAEIARSPVLAVVIARYVEQLNRGLGRWETIKKFAVLDRELTVADGDLTPSLKLRRKVVQERYAELLDAFYTD